MYISKHHNCTATDSLAHWLERQACFRKLTSSTPSVELIFTEYFIYLFYLLTVANSSLIYYNSVNVSFFLSFFPVNVGALPEACVTELIT